MHNYVDGVSITYGSAPRKHIWTYATGLYLPYIHDFHNMDVLATLLECKMFHLMLAVTTTVRLVTMLIQEVQCMMSMHCTL